MFKSDKVINDKLMKRLQQEGLSSERRSIKTFSLLMAYRLFDYLYAELRVPVSHFILGILHISKESVNRLLQFRASDFFPISYTLCVLENDRPVFIL